MQKLLVIGTLAFSLFGVILVLITILIYRNNRYSLIKNEKKYPPDDDVYEDKMALLDPLSDDYEDVKCRLIEYFESEKPFLNPNIRIHDVAEHLYTNKTYLSRAINIKTKKNFCQLVHSYRVKEAIREFSEKPTLRVSELCNLVGFNSMTTFNTAFSRNTGRTPAEWCRDFKKKNINERNYVVNKNNF
ncbi:MAG: helix-turn-helix domain-containing protein [Bacteroidales bacterium]|nr:helix-turn-helix domain-containing protein [Bacteroidales bacterium]